MLPSTAKTLTAYLASLPADLPLKALARSIAAIPPTKYLVRYEELRKKRK